eukprot:scaffold146277_cov18-Prasinocladus_malaysianus.AAC.1
MAPKKATKEMPPVEVNASLSSAWSESAARSGSDCAGSAVRAAADLRIAACAPFSLALLRSAVVLCGRAKQRRDNVFIINEKKMNDDDRINDRYAHAGGKRWT